jgi:hypothetical protein
MTNTNLAYHSKESINIRVTGTNTLAYYGTELITAVKSFTAWAPANGKKLVTQLLRTDAKKDRKVSSS